MSKELTISCTVCSRQTDYYWQNYDRPGHMVCDSCFIELNHQLGSPTEDMGAHDREIFVATFTQWIENLEYHKVTPQSMLERSLIQAFMDEEE